MDNEILTAFLTSNQAAHDRLESKVDSLIADVAGLKVKAGVWGAPAGLLPVLLGMAYLALQ